MSNDFLDQGGPFLSEEDSADLFAIERKLRKTPSRVEQTDIDSLDDKLKGNTGRQFQRAFYPGDEVGPQQQPYTLDAFLKNHEEVDPAQARKVLDLQNKTGMPLDFVSTNIKEVEKAVKVNGFDAQKFQETNPLVSAWMQEHPYHISAFQEDLSHLSYFERLTGNIANRFTTGIANTELSELGFNALMNGRSSGDTAKQRKLEKEISALNNYGIDGFFEQIPGAVAEQLPLQWEILKLGGEFGGKVGQTLTKMHAPSMVGPMVTTFGAGVAYKAGSVIQMYRTEAGLGYLEFEGQIDQAGQKVSHDEARVAAHVVGTINAALELVGETALLRALPGVKYLSRSGMKKVLAVPTLRRAIVGVAKSSAEAFFKEGATEGLQEFVTTTASVLHQMYQDGELENATPLKVIETLFSGENVSRYLEAARGGGQAGLGFGLAGGAPTIIYHLKDIKVAKQRKQFFEALSRTKDMASVKELPTQLQDIFQRITKDGPLETLYVDTEKWNIYWQSQKDDSGNAIDPGDVAEEVLGDRKAYDQAQTTGEVLAIPTSKYAVKLAPTAHHDALSEILLTNPDELTLQEVQENMDKLAKGELEIAKEDKEAVETIEKEIVDKLVAINVPKDIAKTKASVYRAFYVTAKRVKKDPIALFNRYILTFDQRDTIDIPEESSAAPQMPEGDDIYYQDKWDDFNEKRNNVVDARSLFEERQGDRTIPTQEEVAYNQSPQARLDRLKARVGDAPGAEDMVDEAQKENGPVYVYSKSHLFPFPNYSAKPTGQIGEPQILQPHAIGKKQDPLWWGDSKHQATIELIRKHKEEGVPLVINTSSDLVARDDYLEAMPEDTTVNIYLPTKSDSYINGINRIIFKGNPSRLRLERAAQRLREHGINVNLIEPTFESIVKAVGKTNLKKLLGKDWKAEITRAVDPNYIDATDQFDNRKLKAEAEDGAKQESIQQAKPLTKKELDALPNDAEVNITIEFPDSPSKGPFSATKQGAIYEVNSFEKDKHNNRGHWFKQIKVLRYGTPSGNLWVFNGTTPDGKTIHGWDRDKDAAREMVLRGGADNVTAEPIDAVLNYKKRPLLIVGANAMLRERVPFYFLQQNDIHLLYHPSKNKSHKISLVYTPRLAQDAKAAGVITVEAHSVDAAIEKAIGAAVTSARPFDSENQNKKQETKPTDEKRLTWVTNGLYRLPKIAIKDVNNLEAYKEKPVKDKLKIKKPKLVIRKGKAKTDTYFQSQTAPPFYSKLQRTIEEKMPENAPVDQIKGIIKDLKPEELKWSGLSDFLRGKKKVSKADVLAHLQANQIEIEEVEKPELPPNPPDMTVQEGNKYAKHSGYVLPGGENYREVLFKLPVKEGEQGFKTDHFFGEQNILAHVRLNDRTDSEGNKVLFVEEIQSDWHQQGRKRGYEGEFNQGRFDELDKIVRAAGKKAENKEEIPNTQLAAVQEGLISREIYDEYVLLYNRQYSGQVPDAPFRKTWHEFALKRILRMAAEEGYDKIAWTTGDQQVERYESTVREGVDEITWSKVDGKIDFKAIKDGETVLSKSSLSKSETENFLGKQMASSIISSEETNGTLSGDQLTVGGEKLRRFYSDPKAPGSIPNFLNKFGKKYGARVEELKVLTTEESTDQYYLDQSTDAYWHVMDATTGEPIAGSGLFDSMEEARGWVAKTIGSSQTEVHSLPITEKLKKAALEQGFTLFQADKPDAPPRGLIQIGENKINITLLKDADLSTFLHETGHFLLKLLNDEAIKEDAPEQIKEDWNRVKNWLGVEEGKGLTREQHEKFADGFLTYLIEGKAPATELRRPFARIRAWLLSIFKHAQNMRIELTDEVRGVFDRLMATDQEIAAAMAETQSLPTFEDPFAVMNEKDAEKYRDLWQEFPRVAADKLNARKLEQVRRERSKTWKENEEKVREEVEQEVSQERVYIALDTLMGNPPPGMVAGVKLSKKAIIDDYGGEQRLNEIPKVYRIKDGIHPEEAAGLFDYESGDELLNNLATAEPKQQKINRIVEERMHNRFGDKLSEEDLHAAALESLENDIKEEALLTEAKTLASEDFAKRKGLTKKIARRLPTKQALRFQAEESINAKENREIRPIVYQRAMNKASREALDFYLNGDWELALEAKLRELYNFELYVAAVKAKNDIDKGLKYQKRFDKLSVQKKIGLGGEDFLYRINTIRNRFSFAKISLKKLDEQKALVAKQIQNEEEKKAKTGKLSEWAKVRADEGYAIDIPEHVLHENYEKHYLDMVHSEFMATIDTLKQIEHIARLQQKVLASKKYETFKEVKEAFKAAIEAHHDLSDKGPAPHFLSRFDYHKKKGAQLAAEHTRMEYLFEFLGGEAGECWQTAFLPLADAEDVEMAMTNDVVKKLRDIFAGYSRQERASWHVDKIFIPSLKTHKSNGTFIKANLFAMALNMGNEYNAAGLVEGYGWSEAAVMAALDEHFTQQDWATVQQIWDLIDTFWPDIRRQEIELTGIAPEKVEARQVHTKHGVIAGGYYPIHFAPNLSERQKKLEAKDKAQDLFSGFYSRASTKHNHTKARNNTGGKAFSLELNVIDKHIGQVIHDLAFRRAIIDIHKLINDPEIVEAIKAAAGEAMYDQLNPWLIDIAADRNDGYTSTFEAFLAKARAGATTVNMGWKMTTAAVQFLGYTISIQELGVEYALKGLADVYQNPAKLVKTWEFVASRSEFIRDRLTSATYDRDVRDAFKRLNITTTRQGPGSMFGLPPEFNEVLNKSFFMFIAAMDMGVCLPTWLGAYQKAMDGKVANIRAGHEEMAIKYADRTVRVSQGSGTTKDLARIQRGGQTKHLFTMFGSFFIGVLYNQLQKVGVKAFTDMAYEGKSPMAAIASLSLSMCWLWFFPMALEEVILGGGGDDDDELHEKILKWGVRTATYPLSSIVGVRDIFSAIQWKTESGIWRYDLSPVADVPLSIAQLIYFAGVQLPSAAFGDEEITTYDIKRASFAIGYQKRLPMRQLWLTGEYLRDYLNGEQQPDNPLEFIWRSLVVGKERN